MGNNKKNFHPRSDLKAKITAAGLTYQGFARRHRLNFRTLYSVLGGARAGGPVARRIIQKIEGGAS